MKDVMIDLETFGNGKNACVVQVGACYFDRETGEIGATFKRNIDARSSVASGGEIDADTVYWWLSQSPAAIASITGGIKTDIKHAFKDLNDFLADAECIWSHATFDFVIVSETYKRLKMKPNFSYRSARDIRTLIELSGVSTAGDFVGTPHDALDDCKYQVMYCVKALNSLKKV